MIPPRSPLRIVSSEPESLRRDLEQTNKGITDWARSLPDSTNALPGVGKLGSGLLAFGQLARVAPVDGETIQLALPKPDSTQGGKSLSIARLTTTGLVFVNAPPGSRIDGVRRVQLYSSVRMTTIWYDGASDYVSDGTALDVGAGNLP